MRFGLSDEQYEILKQKLLSPLQKQGVQIFVFGSRARGNHHPYSDIDLLYKENPAQPLETGFLAGLRDDIENSGLAIKVDLVCSTELAKSYRASVEKDLIEILL
jgi:predicted nucleotidyltransferase